MINPSNTSQCFNESSEENLLCEVDYFYDYMMGEDNYKKYKDKKGYCTFIYAEMKGAFKYGINDAIENVLNIKEKKGLEIHCLNNQINIRCNLLIFGLITFLLIF